MTVFKLGEDGIVVSNEDISEQQQLLHAHRKTLHNYLLQEATHGALPPVHVVNGIDNTRYEIARIKYRLRSWGEKCEDKSNDDMPNKFYYQQVVEEHDVEQMLAPQTTKDGHAPNIPATYIHAAEMQAEETVSASHPNLVSPVQVSSKNNGQIATSPTHRPARKRSPQKPRGTRRTAIARRIKDQWIRILEENVPMSQAKRDQDLSALSLNIATIEYTQRQAYYLQNTLQETLVIAEGIQDLDYLSDELERSLRVMIKTTIAQIDEITKWVGMVPDYHHCRSINTSATTARTHLMELKAYIIEEDIGKARTWISIMHISLKNLEDRIRGLCSEVIDTLKQEEDIFICDILVRNNYISKN